LAVPAFPLSLVGAVTNTMVYVTNPPPDDLFNLPLRLFIIGFAASAGFLSKILRRNSRLA